MKAYLVPGLSLLVLSCLSLHAAQAKPAAFENEEEDDSFADFGRLATPSPHFHGTELPSSPQQGQPWTPPKTQLPQVAVEAIKTLFDEGLADPRGCEYREIEVAVGNCWSGDSGVVKTHGWIIPGKTPFAICWNGLVYPVVSTGAVADLHADVSALLRADQERRDKNQEKISAAAKGKSYTIYPLLAHGNATEHAGVSYRSMLPFKTALLFRLGESDLAAKLWSQWYDSTNEDPAKDPYLWLASIWTWAWFDRAVDAHMRGDDNLALVSARDLVPIQAAVEAEATRRKFPLGDKQTAYLNYLNQLPDLVADSQRRMTEPAYTPVLEANDPPQGAERIAGLIRDLELVSARQMEEPGGVSLGEDPIIQALIQEGDPAVDPLIKCFEDDPRLTRSVHFWRDNSTDRTVLDVDEAAYVAIATILKTDFFEVNSTGDNLTKRGREVRKEIAAKIRAYWDKYGKLTLPQRWFETLGDDQASPEQWREAVANIVQSSDVTVMAGSSFMGGSVSYPPRKPGDNPPLRGEPLRNLTSPSVSDLLIRRLHVAEQNLDAKAGDDEWNKNLGVADQLARALADWDGRNQLAELRDYSAKLQGQLNEHGRALLRPMAALYEKRAEAGDMSALDDYAKLLATTTRQGITDDEAHDLLRVAWLHPDSPVIQQTVMTIFSNTGAWSHVLDLNNDFQHTVRTLLTTPLVGMDGFRNELVRGLQDKTQIATVTIRGGGLQLGGRGGWGDSLERGAPLLPPDGTVIPLRSCDLYAYLLERLPGAPRCEPYWPEGKRDKGDAALVNYLQTYGERFQYGPDQFDDGDGWAGLMTPFGALAPVGRDQARLRFPVLEHPATAEDLRQHRAIFALEGQRRLWKLPQLPVEVLWTTLKDEPRQSGGGISPDGKPIYTTFYETDGVAWQAEKVLTNGKWERYLGVVTKHHVARVPASEIEFVLPGLWTRLPHGFDCQLTTPKADPKSWRGCYAYDPVPEGQPVLATLTVRNRSGLDQTLPANLFQDASHAKTLPDGIKLALLYSEKPSPKPKPNMGFPQPNEMGPWKEIPIRAGSYPSRASAGDAKTVMALASTTEKAIFKIDLRDFFDLSKPGSYRLQAAIERPDAMDGQPSETSFAIVASTSLDTIGPTKSPGNP
jgi:hypothetical protein